MDFDEQFLQEMGLSAMPEDQKQAFLDYVQEELEIRIGERISKGLTETQLNEFDMITDQQEAAKWLEKNRPDYREIVTRTINEMKDEILCVRGNCEAEVDQMVLDFPCMAEYAIIYIENKILYITHGHKINPENPPKLNKGDFLMNGHTHIGAIKDMDGFIYLNPGSVSIPKDGIHSYMIYENGCFKLKEVSC